MKIKVKTLRSLLKLASETTGEAQDFSGFKAMAEKMKLDNDDYLYKKIYQRIKNERDSDTVGLHVYPLNRIAKFLGWSSFKEFETDITDVVHPQLKSLLGTYYCFVRANLATATVFRSPVNIVEASRKVWFVLKGPSFEYKGELKLQEGCLFVLMTTGKGKLFHHIYKIGTREAPEVMQGVFSGVSTAFDPIGGRTVLVRQRSKFDDLENGALRVAALKRSKISGERILASYFGSYENNNLLPSRSATFTFADLEE